MSRLDTTAGLWNHGPAGELSEDAMSEEIKPRRFINVDTAPVPPWTVTINLSISKVQEVFESAIDTSLQAAIDVHGDDLYYTFTERFETRQKAREKSSFTIILRPSSGKTIIEMNIIPIDTDRYLMFFKALAFRFQLKKIVFNIDAPLISEENRTLPATTPPPKPKRTAKMILAAYKARKRREPELTLKQFCSDIGANYDSIKAAKYRYSKGKKKGRKSLP